VKNRIEKQGFYLAFFMSKINKVKIITLSGGVIFLYKKLKRRDEL
jgi:hypothetical protein